MIAPVTVDPFPQKDGGDCAVAALAMYLGVGYQQVRAVCHKNVGTDGLTDRQILNTARKLKQPLRWTNDGDLSETIGILKVERPEHDNPKELEYHTVVLLKGVIYNPADGLIWTDIDAFFKARRWKPVGVFVRKEGSER